MASTSIYGQVLDAVKSAIESLSTGVDSSSIVIQEVARFQEGMSKPFISVSPYGAERLPSGTNLRENTQYPVLVAYIADPDVSSLDARLLIRQSIRRRFHHADLSGISGTNVGFMQTTVEPANVVEVAQFLRNQLFVSGMIVLAEVREPRS